MRSVRGLLTATVTSLWLTAMVEPASAESRSAGAYVDESGKPTAEARTIAVSSGRQSRSNSQSNCTWRVVNADDNQFAVYDEDGTRLRSDTGRWLQRVCDDTPVAVNGVFVVPERSRSVDPAAVAQEARQSVTIPEPPISTSPRADRKLYTRVLTWLWVDPGWWRGYTAIADAGGVSTTVVARPVRAVWSMGDGGQVVCDGPGVEWHPGMADNETNCAYSYRHSSAGQSGGTFTMAVTVEFEVGWTSNVGAGGSLARITRSASRTVEVGEIQAIETQ